MTTNPAATLASPDNTYSQEWGQVLAAIRPAVIWGVVVAVVVFAFFGLWSGLARLDSAAIATGQVVLSDNRKTVQHLEGGIIEDILVKEGDQVITGQPLIYLNATSASAQQDLLLGQLRSAKAAELRLIAERDGENDLVFDHHLLAGVKNQALQEIMASQAKLFETKKASLAGKIDVLQEKIMQFNEKIKGLNVQIVEAQKQVVLIGDEIFTTEHLVEKGLEKKPKLSELQRSAAQLRSQKAGYITEIATTRGAIAETQLEIINAQTDYLKEVMIELKEVQQQVADLQEQIEASGDVLERTIITAPQSGKVTGLKFHTLGGVISPGVPIMDIVPQDDRLIIEAQVKPQDIDVVHEGLNAKVMLSAYKSRFVPRLDGTVVQVSADRFTDETTGEAYFMARIEISKEVLQSLEANVELYPGMPAEVFITTGEGTFLEYLASPIIDSFRRSFKED